MYLPIMHRKPNYVTRQWDEIVTYPNGTQAIVTYVDWVGYDKKGKATAHLKTPLRYKWVKWWYANSGLVEV